VRSVPFLEGIYCLPFYVLLQPGTSHSLAFADDLCRLGG
jgi:hypothetical protein